MATSRRDNEIRISPNPAVFDLPILVGIDEGLFEKHGVHLTYSAQYRTGRTIRTSPTCSSA